MTEFFEWREAPPGDYAVVGDPVSHSLSPGMHQAAYESEGLDLRYLGIRVPEEEFAPAMERLASLGYEGANVTVPLKERAAEWVEHPEPFAGRIGAVNTVRFRDSVGINTDWPGFMETLRDLDMLPQCRVLLLGAGGSARTIVAALCETGHDVRIYSRSPERARRLVHDLEVEAEVLDRPTLAGIDLVVNATSASLHGDEVELDWDSAPASCFAYELMYGKPSPFLEAATRRGLRTADGLPLLVAQGALSFEFWLRRPAPRDAMRMAVQA